MCSSDEVLNVKLSRIKALIKDETPFEDPYFPRSITSLTYVYDGRQQYETVVFKRPQEIFPKFTFINLTTECTVDLEWKKWNSKNGLIYAFVFLSHFPALKVQLLGDPLVDHIDMDAIYDRLYLGIVWFRFWRFGRWINVLTDSYLPVETRFSKLLSIQALEPSCQIFYPLMEKAFAKLNSTYEALEAIKARDALTDLTGGLCEYYVIESLSQERLFHILLKSHLNNSLIACWRSAEKQKSTYWTEIKPTDNETTKAANKHRSSSEVNEKRLYVITAISKNVQKINHYNIKFPTVATKTIPMLRIQKPIDSVIEWTGNFCDKKKVSFRDRKNWSKIPYQFMKENEPVKNKKKNEFWITLADFCANFTAVIICSIDVSDLQAAMSQIESPRRSSRKSTKTPRKLVLLKENDSSEDNNNTKAEDEVRNDDRWSYKTFDNFFPHNGWSIRTLHGEWKTESNGGPRCIEKQHDRNPKFYARFRESDCFPTQGVPMNEIEKCHIIVSLIQDYRGRWDKVNVLKSFVLLGISIYKVNSQSKRSLSKRSHVFTHESTIPLREIITRVNLEPGYYCFVPYTLCEKHVGKFLLRIAKRSSEDLLREDSWNMYLNFD